MKFREEFVFFFWKVKSKPFGKWSFLLSKCRSCHTLKIFIKQSDHFSLYVKLCPTLVYFILSEVVRTISIISSSSCCHYYDKLHCSTPGLLCLEDYVFSSILRSPSSYAIPHLFKWRHMQNLAVVNSSSWQGHRQWISCTQKSCASKQPWHKIWCFMPLRRGTSLTLFHVCLITLQLMEQTQKSCFQGANSLSKCSGWITKHQRWQTNLSQWTSIFSYALHEKLDQIFTWQLP